MTDSSDTSLGRDLPVATRAAGLARLESFLPKAGRRYAAERNYDRGPGKHDRVSGLSPYLRHRLVLEEEVIRGLLDRHDPETADKFLSEVFWRSYWKGWLQLRPEVWERYRRDVGALAGALESGSSLRDRWQAACSGATGIGCFDAWAQELAGTGYLHNHARMWFASIWIFTLKLPWQLGADFFLRHLLDGDPASNTLSWRWVAGLQTKGKTYLARPDNIAKFTGGRFTPGKELAGEAIALEEPPLGEPMARLDEPSLPDPDAPTLLVVGEDDLLPEKLVAGLGGITAAAPLLTHGRRSPLGLSSLVRDFTLEAFDDVFARLKDKRAIPCERGPLNSIWETGDYVHWAKESGARQVVMPFAALGPGAEAAEELRCALTAEGISFVPLLRSWDRTVWPKATHGFFRFKKPIPGMLEDLGLARQGRLAL